MVRKVQVLLYFALAWSHFLLPAGASSMLTEQLCRACKNSRRQEWEEPVGRREQQQLVCCCLCHQPGGGRSDCRSTY